MTEELDKAEVIEDNVEINKVGSIETKVTNDNISEDLCHNFQLFS